jgi:hypothetical protein
MTSSNYIVKVTYSDGTRSNEEFAKPVGTHLTSFYSDNKTNSKMCDYQKVDNSKKKPVDLTNIIIKPPVWLQGTWQIIDGLSKYKFTANDILIDGYSLIESLKAGEIANFEQEVIGTSYYTLKLFYPNGDWTTEQFASTVSKGSISSLYSDMRSFRRSETVFNYNRE